MDIIIISITISTILPLILLFFLSVNSITAIQGVKEILKIIMDEIVKERRNENKRKCLKNTL